MSKQRTINRALEIADEALDNELEAMNRAREYAALAVQRDDALRKMQAVLREDATATAESIQGARQVALDVLANAEQQRREEGTDPPEPKRVDCERWAVMPRSGWIRLHNSEQNSIDDCAIAEGDRVCRVHVREIAEGEPTYGELFKKHEKYEGLLRAINKSCCSGDNPTISHAQAVEAVLKAGFSQCGPACAAVHTERDKLQVEVDDYKAMYRCLEIDCDRLQADLDVIAEVLSRISKARRGSARESERLGR